MSAQIQTFWYPFRLFKVQFKCLMCKRGFCLSRQRHVKRDELLCNFHEIPHRDPKAVERCLFFGSDGTGKTRRDNNHCSKLHVTFKFIDISHAFVINNRIAFLLWVLLDARVNVRGLISLSLLYKFKLFIFHYLELQ